MTTITATGYMIHDNAGTAIAAVGQTEDEVRAAVAAECGPWEDRDGNTVGADDPAFGLDAKFVIFPATAALIAQVNDEGGMIGWSIVNDIACRTDEGRRAILGWLVNGTDKADLETEIAAIRNVALAEIDADDGSVWIEGVQGDRWLTDAEITGVAMAITH